MSLFWHSLWLLATLTQRDLTFTLLQWLWLQQCLVVYCRIWGGVGCTKLGFTLSFPEHRQLFPVGFFFFFCLCGCGKTRFAVRATTFGNRSLDVQPYTSGDTDKAVVTSWWESLQGCVSGSCKWNWLNSLDNDCGSAHSFVHFHCVTWEWGRWEKWLLFNSYICIITPVLGH